MTSPDMWMRLGACRKLPDHLLDTMYPDRAADAGNAKKVCATCPVKVTCRAWAISTEEEHGVWGGLTYPERGDHIDHGTPIRPCPRCHLDWVPATPGQTACRPCLAEPAKAHDQPTWRTAASYGPGHTAAILARNDEIRRLAGQEWGDKRIAAHLGTYETLIRRVRALLGIPSGYAARLRGAGDAIDADAIAAVEAGQARVTTLNLVERSELWRRHAAAGGAVGTFARRYGISSKTLRAVREAAQQSQAVAA